MKRSLAVLIGLLTLGVGAAQAEPGPEPGSSNFSIFVHELGGDRDMYSKTEFAVGQGWDFGDRAAYACAWVEFFQAGTELFEVHYEMVDGYPIPIEINDLFGIEAPDSQIGGLCGDGNGSGANIHHDGTDHFPHGTSLNFFQNDVRIATIDYSLQEPNGCDRGYWTPGNQAGEAWLWWDEDGPQNDGHHDLNCGGGPGEPVAIVRADVKHMASGVEVCTEDSLAGNWCSDAPLPTPTEHSGHVTLRLRGNLRAVGNIHSSHACTTDRNVVIERRTHRRWKVVGETIATHHYQLRVPPREGTYRAQLTASVLTNGDTCEAATSPKRVYRS